MSVNTSKALSDLVHWSKYAKYLPEKGRRETFAETVDRNKEMHQRKFPQLHDQIEQVYRDYVHTKKVLPAMRSLQFGGRAIETKNVRMFNCLSRDTSFITEAGLKSFFDFRDGDTATVLAPSGQWRNATVRSYGEQELYDVTLVKGKSSLTVRATKDHRWLLRDGSETTELAPGHILRGAPVTANFVYEEAEPLERLYWAYGYVYGDGTTVQDASGNARYSMVRLCGRDAAYENRFIELGFKTSRPLSAKGDVFAYTGTYLKTPPNPSQDSPALIRAFVEGFLAADGEKQTSQTSPSRYKSIQSSYPGHQRFIEECFEVAGYYVVHQADLTGQVTNFGVRPQTYKYSLNSHIGTGPNNGWSVKSVSPSGHTETVWCLEVEEEHAFVLSGGVVTGNCSYLPVDSLDSFSEAMFLLLAGCGVGYSVRCHHVEQLPEVKAFKTIQNPYVIEDTIEGWADAIKALISSYLVHGNHYEFNYSAIRPQGSPLVTSGGKAPGPEPLRNALNKIDLLLFDCDEGEHLTPLMCHDIMCHLADAVRAGGIRRSAMISLFDKDDEEMLNAKSGAWWEENPQRGRANNSVALLRGETTEEEFKAIWAKVEASGAGEPGIFWTDHRDWGTNPCCEVALRPFQMCNLCEINASNVENEFDLNERAVAASFIGTLQAAYTDFNYLRPIWKQTVDEDALIGVGATGIASGNFTRFNLGDTALVVKSVNRATSQLIGINSAARTTVVKPSGTASIILGTSSGIHAWHNDYYVRTIRLGKEEPIAVYLAANHPKMLEQDLFDPNGWVASIPIKAPEGATTRHESVTELLERIRKVNVEWIQGGHRRGENFNNVSATVSVKDDEWEQVGRWMWDNRADYSGISVLNYDGGSYQQAPFQDITREQYLSMVENFTPVDLTRIREEEDQTDFVGEVACSADGCVVVYL